MNTKPLAWLSNTSSFSYVSNLIISNKPLHLVKNISHPLTIVNPVLLIRCYPGFLVNRAWLAHPLKGLMRPAVFDDRSSK